MKNKSLLKELRKTNRLLTLIVMAQGSSKLSDELLFDAEEAVENGAVAKNILQKRRKANHPSPK